MKKVILAIFGVIFTSVLFTQNSFATSDYSLTFNSQSPSGSEYLCFDNEASVGRNCTDYNYLIVTTNINTNVSLSLNFTGNVSISQNYYPFPSDTTIYSLSEFNSNSDLYAITVKPTIYGNSANLNSDWYVTYTLSENLPGSGGGSVTPDCPEPVIPDCEEPFIVRLFEGSFWNVATAIIALVVPILALFLVFRLIHGLIYGKGV